MTDFTDFSDMFVVNDVMHCKRCMRGDQDFSLSTTGLSLSEVTEAAITHVATHADEDVKQHRAVDDNELLAILDEVQEEVKVFLDEMTASYGPRIQKAVTQFGIGGLGKFFG